MELLRVTLAGGDVGTIVYRVISRHVANDGYRCFLVRDASGFTGYIASSQGEAVNEWRMPSPSAKRFNEILDTLWIGLVPDQGAGTLLDDPRPYVTLRVERGATVGELSYHGDPPPQWRGVFELLDIIHETERS